MHVSQQRTERENEEASSRNMAAPAAFGGFSITTTINQQAMKQMKEADREARGLPPKKTPTNLFDSLVKQGKKVLKDAVADVQDASVPIVFADYHLIMVATAKFSDTKPEENVYYVGAFQRWFNVSSGIINWAISMDRLVRQTLGQ